MLGYFIDAKAVALYNAALPLSNLLKIVMSSLGFIYVPALTQAYAKKRIKVMKRCYQITTKWSFAFSLPIFFVIFLFPQNVLTVFGLTYTDAYLVLQILALGHFLDPYFGPNWHTLINIGKTNFLAKSFFAGFIINVLLNIALIPKMGISGAAIASTISFGMIEIIMTTKLFTMYKIHPFSKNFLKLNIIAISLLYLFSSFIRKFFAINWLSCLLIFLLLYGLLVIFTKCIDKEDMVLISILESVTGKKFSRIKNFLERFII